MDQALARFAKVVGADWVFTDEDHLSPYSDQFAPGNAAAHAPGGAVGPGSVEEVQAIVRIAAETGVPLWTVSTGRNLAYGGSAPVMPGCVVLDLRRLNKVLEVDDELGYALVEPGVTFFDLNDHLTRIGSRLWISSPAPGWGSVMGNALERGFGGMPYGDHAQQICGLEVVLADGTLLRTGMGAVPGAKTWQLHKGGFGPAWDQAFCQSNYGVVTKLGIWLMPRPEAVASGRVVFPREEDLALAVDAMRPLRVEGIVNGVPSMRNAVGVAIGQSQRSAWYDKPGPIPDDVIETIKTKLNVGWWTQNFGLYGRADVVQANLRHVRTAYDRLPGVRFEVEVTEGDVLKEPGRGGKPGTGLPGLAGLRVVDWRGGKGGHIDFSPVLPPRGEDAMRIYRLCRRIVEGGGQDFMGTFYNFGRAMTLICLVGFDAAKAEETARVRGLFSALVKEAGAAGYGEYRTHISYMDEVADLYRWNDGALQRFNARIKDALDPKGVLSPGKQGIWPRRYRTEG
jgi:4-cresol dehydrogenase (hydroxylating)